MRRLPQPRRRLLFRFGFTFTFSTTTRDLHPSTNATRHEWPSTCGPLARGDSSRWEGLLLQHADESHAMDQARRFVDSRRGNAIALHIQTESDTFTAAGLRDCPCDNSMAVSHRQEHGSQILAQQGDERDVVGSTGSCEASCAEATSPANTGAVSIP